MARARHQEGSLGIRGKGPSASYFVVYRIYNDEFPEGRQKKKTIGLVKEMSKREANRRKLEIVSEETQQLPEAPAAAKRGTVTFRDFWLQRFLPLKSHWRPATKKGFMFIVEAYILEKFGDLALDSIDKVMIQSHLNHLGKKYSKSTVGHVRTKMVEIFEEAVEQEFLPKNPAKRTNIPQEARAPSRPVLMPEELMALIDGVSDLRDKALLCSASFCAFRTSEVFGLLWGKFNHNETTGAAWFDVSQIAWEGKIYQETKTDASAGRVHIGPRTLAAILSWKEACKDTSSAALIFPSTNRNGRSKKGAPMWPGSWLTKRIRPIAQKLGITFNVDIRALRRTANTLAQEAGASLGSAQGMLRHASADTTAKIYTRTIPENVKRAVNDFEKFVHDARKAG